MFLTKIIVLLFVFSFTANISANPSSAEGNRDSGTAIAGNLPNEIIKKLRDEIRRLKRIAGDYETRMGVFTKENKKLRDEIQRLKRIAGDYETRMGELTKENKKLRDEIRRLKRIAGDYETRMGVLNKKNKELRAENKKLKTANRRFDKENRELYGLVKKLREKLGDLQKSCQTNNPLGPSSAPLLPPPVGPPRAESSRSSLLAPPCTEEECAAPVRSRGFRGNTGGVDFPGDTGGNDGVPSESRGVR